MSKTGATGKSEIESAAGILRFVKMANYIFVYTNLHRICENNEESTKIYEFLLKNIQKQHGKTFTPEKNMVYLYQTVEGSFFVQKLYKTELKPQTKKSVHVEEDKPMAKKWVYLFTEGDATMRNLLGGKGANLAEMTNIGLPVPQGFTITTEACTQYYEDGREINDEIQGQINEYIAKMEEITAKEVLNMVEKLEKIISQSQNIVFFGGAGVSTESGIPDFRSVDGLYHQKYDYPPETILSHTFWEERPEEFYRFYRDKLIVKGAKPNAAHLRLAKLEREGKLKAVITQNIDGLHQAAGSKTVYELHGSTLRNYCVKCGAFYDVDFIANSTGVPRCPKCGGIIKPDVVLYEEVLDEQVLSGAVSAIRRADTLIIGGTSLVVYPAAGLIRYFRGDHLVVINMQPTNADAEADLCIAKPIGQVLSEDVVVEE